MIANVVMGVNDAATNSVRFSEKKEGYGIQQSRRLDLID